ncbi:hypothetical protein HMPREF9447_03164 [Bacteroides oleiciplenus YIT 12058]|uniref:Uncharacterized protein n=1 Tax=Bacteroides oleiciplenus YIT 12058 TaxID=742727 RepID=K9E200_9BACE|nr:hypothetical protein HMPREF9447_03164 [Bacteroides oleiciplenus YIT 12058]
MSVKHENKNLSSASELYLLLTFSLPTPYLLPTFSLSINKEKVGSRYDRIVVQIGSR